MYVEDIEIEDALDILLDKIEVKSSESVSLLGSLGRVLSVDIYSEINIPNNRKSAVDGYGITMKDIPGTKLKVRGMIKAGGKLPDFDIELGETINIMTGGMVPNEFQMVIPKEFILRDGDDIRIERGISVNSNIISKGEDVSIGELVVSKGTKIHQGVIVMLANLGISKVEVIKKPVIGVISTGDEVKEPGESLELGEVYNSNLYGVLAIIKRNNSIGIKYKIARDSIDEISEAINRAINDCDLVITTGGVSVGEFDYLGDAYLKSKVKKLLYRIKIKPGRPFLCGQKGGKLVVSLPGSPGAAFILMEKIGIPLLRKLSGNIPKKRIFIGEMAEDFKKRSTVKRFIRIVIKFDSGFKVYLSGKQRASALFSSVYYNGIGEIEAGNEGLNIGDKINFTFREDVDI